ncbi:hypothetical protein ElyMa_006365900 [Elysia marginata]|uniref:Uncharacterized protein n=1 Tax=Elysia marginata TaxID=1093978 RepID=A0AAV4HNF0_9GAST|nr:hypothetical protein ElyMa_006365900 [Elysia marginata]
MTGEGGKANKAGNEPAKQTRGDNQTGKRDSSVKTAPAPVKGDPGKPAENVSANCSVNISNHVIKKHESTPDPQTNCTVQITPKEHDVSSPTAPAIEKVESHTKVVSKREVNSRGSKKSSKSSKSNFCSVS